MYKLVVLILLATGSVCAYHKYHKERSFKEFEDARVDTSDPKNSSGEGSSSTTRRRRVFPEIEIIDPDWKFDFYVMEEDDDEIVLEEDSDKNKVNFSTEKEGRFRLESLKFQFKSEDETRLYMRFKSKRTKAEWTVISRVCTPPRKGSDLEQHARRHAVYANTLTPRKADALYDGATSEIDEEDTPVTIKIKWVEEVLRKKGLKPRLYRNPDSRGGRIYIGCPILVEHEVLETLEDTIGACGPFGYGA